MAGMGPGPDFTAVEVAMRALVRCGFLVLLLLAGCAAPVARFGAAAPTLPPVAAGAARIFVDRAVEPYETREMARVQLNGEPAGAVGNGAVFYRDVPPGQYAVTILGTEAYPNQFKNVLLRPGETAFARIESLSSWSACTNIIDCYPTFVVRLVDPATASADMQSLALVAG